MAGAPIIRAAKNLVMSAQTNPALRYRLLFCHGLGSAKRDVIANRIGQWALSRGVTLNNLAYQNHGDASCVWDINDWSADVLNELQIKKPNVNHIKSTESEEQTAPEFSTETVIVCNSAASQAVLRALLKMEKTHVDSNSEYHWPAGLLMISPGIGMNVERYVSRVMSPESLRALKNGETLLHPSADPKLRIKVDLKCLNDFVNNCPTRQNIETIPIRCPIRVIHGIYDKLVPYRNSVDFMQRVQSKDKALYLINDGHFVKDQQIISYALDSLWDVINNNKQL